MYKLEIYKAGVLVQRLLYLDMEYMEMIDKLDNATYNGCNCFVWKNITKAEVYSLHGRN